MRKIIAKISEYPKNFNGLNLARSELKTCAESPIEVLMGLFDFNGLG